MRPYRDFWPIYLGAHRGKWTQRFHLVASTIGAIAVFSAIGLGMPLLAPGGILLALGLAFASHYLIEGNHPTIAKNPLWSAVGDVHMCFLLVTGRLPAEMKRMGLERPIVERFVWAKAKN